MFYLRILGIITAIFCAGCGINMQDDKESPIISPSKQYSVFATVNRTNEKADDYAIVIIHLLDSSGQEIEVVNSGCGDAMKWALGWMNDSDIVILQSSDAGDRAYEIKAGHLVPMTSLSEGMKAKANEIKERKYESRN